MSSAVIYAVEIIVVFGYDFAAVCIPGSHSWSIPFVNPKLITTAAVTSKAFRLVAIFSIVRETKGEGPRGKLYFSHFRC